MVQQKKIHTVYNAMSVPVLHKSASIIVTTDVTVTHFSVNKIKIISNLTTSLKVGKHFKRCG